MRRSKAMIPRSHPDRLRTQNLSYHQSLSLPTVRKPIAKSALYFAFLQGADFATTLLVIKLGGGEQNMFVAGLMALYPVRGLALAKVIVLAIACAAVALRKRRILTWANVFYSAVVIWNLSVIARLVLRG
jgi:hypothetical protein